MPALPEDLTVARDHGAHDGVGLDRSGAFGRELYRPRQAHIVGLQ
jgi:hypothetical protein